MVVNDSVLTIFYLFDRVCLSMIEINDWLKVSQNCIFYQTKSIFNSINAPNGVFFNFSNKKKQSICVRLLFLYYITSYFTCLFYALPRDISFTSEFIS